MNAAITIQAGATLTTTGNGTGVNAGTLAGGGNWLPGSGTLLLVTIPVTSIKLTVTDETYAFKVQDSPDGTNWTDRSVNRAAADDANLTVDGGGGTITFLALIKNPAHVRLVHTLGGTSPSMVIAACTLTPLLTFLVKGTIVTKAHGFIAVNADSGSTELNEAIYQAGINSAQGANYIEFTGLTRETSDLLSQGGKVVIGIAPTA